MDRFRINSDSDSDSDSRRDLKLLQRSFLGQVNIEVTRGHQRSNILKIAIFSRTFAIISTSMIARRNSKKTSGSSLQAPVTFSLIFDLRSTVFALEIIKEKAIVFQRDGFSLITF